VSTRPTPVKFGSIGAALVDVPAGGVRLPDLDQLVAHRPTVAVEHPPRDHDPLAHRFAVVLDGQVGLEPADVAVPEDRREQLDRLRVGVVQVLGGMAQQAAAVGRVVEPGLGLLRAGTFVVLADPGHLRIDLRLRGRGGVRADVRLGVWALGHPPKVRRSGAGWLQRIPLSGNKWW
jgi:hypothetical protein